MQCMSNMKFPGSPTFYVFPKILVGNPSHRSSKKAILLFGLGLPGKLFSQRAGNEGPTVGAKPNMLQRAHQCL